MKKEDIQKKLSISDKYFNEFDYNPLRLALDQEFDRNVVIDNGKDYRERAIDCVLKAKVPFISETNTISDMIKMFIKIVNPLTGNEMEYLNGSGNFIEYTATFKDMQTKDIISISFNSEAIRFTPHK